MYEEVACTLSLVSPVITSCVTPVQYQRQEIDTIHRSNLGFASCTCTRVCAHTVLRACVCKLHRWLCPTCHDISAFTVCGIYPCTCVYNQFIVSTPEEDPVVYIFDLLCTCFPTVDPQPASHFLPPQTVLQCRASLVPCGFVSLRQDLGCWGICLLGSAKCLPKSTCQQAWYSYIV